MKNRIYIVYEQNFWSLYDLSTRNVLVSGFGSFNQAKKFAKEYRIKLAG